MNSLVAAFIFSRDTLSKLKWDSLGFVPKWKEEGRPKPTPLFQLYIPNRFVEKLPKVVDNIRTKLPIGVETEGRLLGNKSLILQFFRASLRLVEHSILSQVMKSPLTTIQLSF